MECAMANPDKLRLQEIPLQKCLTAVFNLYIQLIYRNYKRRCCFWPQLRQLYFSNPEFFASGAAAQGFHALYVCFMCISVGDMSGSRPNTKAQKTWSKTQIWKVALQLNTYATIHVFVFPPSLHRRSASTEQASALQVLSKPKTPDTSSTLQTCL